MWNAFNIIVWLMITLRTRNAEPNRILKCALELVLAIESAEKDMRDIQRAKVNSTLTQVHMVDKRTQKLKSLLFIVVDETT